MFPSNLTYLTMTLIFGLAFHAVLWARNARFLWSHHRTILKVIVYAELWTLITDPLGGLMGAWYFTESQTLGLWFFGVMPPEDLLGAAITSSAAACAILVFGYSPRKWI
jgi:hypothetical protein